MSSVFLLVFSFLALSYGDDTVTGPGNKCRPHEFCPENNAKGVDYIKEWWSKVSEQKPIKCAKSDFFNDKIDQSLWSLFDSIPIVSSRECRENETSIPFEIRGNGIKIENGLLEGSGKLKLLSRWPEEMKDEEKNKSCISVATMGGIRKPVEIIGTFLNGYLEGNAKLKLDDKSVTIAQYRRSAITGLRREWNSDGTLVSIGYRYRDAPMGMCWANSFKHLLYEDCSVFGRTEQPIKSLLMPLNETQPQEIFSGTYYVDQAYLVDRSHVSLKQISPLDDCILKVEFEEVAKADGKLFLMHSNEDKPSSNFDPNKSLCNFKSDDATLSASDRLVKWFNETETQFYVNPANMLDKMKRQDKPVMLDKALILIPEVALLPNENKTYTRNLNITVLNGPPATFSIGSLHLDTKNRLHGYCELTIFASGNNLTGTDPTLGWSVKSIKGIFVHGLLQGRVLVGIQDGRWLLGHVQDGALHGPQILHGVLQILPPRKTLNYYSYMDGFAFIGQYSNGRATGDFWIGMKGGGNLHGQLDPTNSTVTGDNIAYIYPDQETVFLGKFENKIMIKAKESSVLDWGCNPYGMPIVTKYAEPSGPDFYYDPPTNESFGAGPPNVRDPYERKWLELRPSSIQGAGEGVFLLRDAPVRRFVSLYSGIFYDFPLEANIYAETKVMNTSKTDDYRRACKKYSLGLSTFHTTIDIPPELDLPETFHPTLGPKVNHNFRLNNSYYSEIEHPRWGTIQSVTLSRDVKAGEELYTYYGYKAVTANVGGQFPGDFLWYWELKAAIERQERLDKEAKLEEEKKNRKETETKVKATKERKTQKKKTFDKQAL